jgi:hypothetical protein
MSGSILARISIDTPERTRESITPRDGELPSDSALSCQGIFSAPGLAGSAHIPLGLVGETADHD